MKKRLPLIIPFITICIGFLIAFYGWSLTNKSILNQAKLNFDVRTKGVADLVKAKVTRDVYVLYGLRGLFSASKSVERAEFYSYLDTINLKENYPGISGVGFVELVKNKDKAEFVKGVKEDKTINTLGYPNFKIYPEIEKEEYLVTKYSYPENETAKTMGFDISSEENRKLVADIARDSNQPEMTGRINLVSDNTPAFILILPIYFNNKLNDQIDNRRENLQGFVVVWLKLDKFFNEALETEDFNQIPYDFHVVDRLVSDKNSRGDLIFDLDKKGILTYSGKSITSEISMNFGEREWKLLFSTDPSFGLTRIEKIVPMLVLVSVTVFSLLIFFVIIVLISSQRRALKIAEKMTIGFRESEEKFKAVTESAKDSIVMMNSKGEVVLWSKAAEEAFGYKEEEVIGKELHSIIPAMVEHKEKKDNLTHFGETGESAVLGKAIELPVVNKNGGEFTVELTVSRVKLKGEWHAVGIMRDVTERKKNDMILNKRTKELERMNELMVGRELKMIELKKEINNLNK